jgi:hypothetical protein
MAAQNETNTGIHYWQRSNTDWATYMANSGSGKSFSGGTACTMGSITTHAIRMRSDNSSNQGFIWENNAETALMGLTGLGELYVTGNVGIGTTSPSTKLSLGNDLNKTKLGLWDNGTSSIGMGIQGSEFGFYLDQSGNKYTFYDTKAWTNALVTIKGTGNVGIGDSSPSYKLDVAGTGRFTGDITGNLVGNATTATTLATARTIGGVSFNGSSNINLPGVNAAGNQNTTGNAATATTAGTVTTAAQPAITSVGTLTSLTVSGDLTVNGTTTTVNTTNIVVEDSLIQLASANAADSVDIGMYGKYVSGSTYYTGLVRDASAGGWHLFTSTTAPSSAGVANLSYSPLRTAALTCTTLNTTGKVGIGTNNPLYELDIKKNGTDPFLNIENSIYNSGGGSASIYMSGGRADNNQNSSLEMQLNHTGNQSGWKMYWRGVDTTRTRINIPMTLDNTGELTVLGNVGIGTDSPLDKLDVNGDAFIRGNSLWLKGRGDDTAPRMRLHHSGSNAYIDWETGRLAIRSDTSECFSILANGNVGIGNINPLAAAKLWVEGTGSGSGNNTYGYLNPSGSGTYTASGIAYSIGCSGRMRSTEFNAISDERKKKDFVEISDNTALDLVNQLKVYNYKWKGELDDITLKTGVKAQEVEAIYPSCITQIEEVVPSILEEVVYNNKKFNLTDVSGLAIGDKLKIFYNDKVNLKEKELQAIIVNIIGNEVEIDQEIKDDDDKIYVYGKFYNDVRTIDYNSLNMLSIGAIKSLVTKNNVLENKVATLETELAAIKAHLGL